MMMSTIPYVQLEGGESLDSFHFSYLMPPYRCMNIVHTLQYTHQQVQIDVNLEVISSICHQVVHLQSWEGKGSVNHT